MSWFPPFPDLVTAAVDRVQLDPEVIGDGASVSTILPDPLVLPAVTVRRIGGVEIDPVLDAPVLSVQVRADTELDAERIARSVRHTLMTWPCGAQPPGMTVVKVRGQTGPAAIPDDERAEPIPRVVMALRVIVRAA